MPSILLHRDGIVWATRPNHHFQPGEKLNIVTHSHGGNVVAEATQNGIAHKIDTLVTLGVPIRPDYNFSESQVGQHLNVYSNNDKVQINGGPPVLVYADPATGPYYSFEAGRTVDLPGVKNLDATSQAGDHSELWSKPGTWDKVVVPELKK